MSIILSAIVAFAVTAVIGWFLIPILRAAKVGQSIKEIGPVWHKSKEGTPTMGGIMFIIGIAVAVVIFSWKDMRNGDFSALFVLLFSVVFALIGFVDDFAKVRKRENTGLTAGKKFLLQLIAAVAFLILLRLTDHMTFDLYIPFVNREFSIAWPVYMIFAAFVIVGCVNAVNITDGLDGLASMVTLPVAVFFAVLASWWDKGAVSIFAGALAGGLVGFLIYNFHPAKVFMGDTGSLFLGAAVCGLAMVLDAPLILVFVGIIYIVETLSDIIQVTYFRLTHGKRLFRMAPLHHHLEMGGWPEVRIVLVFCGITVAFCILAFVGVMYRYAV